METVVSSRALTLSLDARGRALSLRHRASGVELLSAASHPVGLWELGLVRPATCTDPLPPMRIPETAYAGHEWFANRDEYRADLLLDSDAAPAPVVRDEDDGAALTWSLDVPGGNAVLDLAIAGGFVTEGLPAERGKRVVKV